MIKFRCAEVVRYGEKQSERKFMKKIYIWGTGNEAEKCIANLNFDECQIMGYIETKPQRIEWKKKRFLPLNSYLKLNTIILLLQIFIMKK